MGPLELLRSRLAEPVEVGPGWEMADRLFVARVAGGWHVDFFGDPFGESFEELMAVLADPETAEELAWLSLRGPDEGANGTRNWDLTALAEAEGSFPRLRCLSIERNGPADHNATIVARTYEEEGVLARLLEKSPALESLTSPSAPGPEFFEVGPRPSLQCLGVDAGYDHLGFIANLARSGCFPGLVALEFGEVTDLSLRETPGAVTPMDDFRTLFRSPAFSSVQTFGWRNPGCSSAEVAELRAIDPSHQVQVVRWSAEWVR